MSSRTCGVAVAVKAIMGIYRRKYNFSLIPIDGYNFCCYAYNSKFKGKLGMFYLIVVLIKFPLRSCFTYWNFAKVNSSPSETLS